MGDACTGRCLCGAVSFEAKAVPEHFGACHCSMCRRWGSGPLLAVMVNDVGFEGAEHIGRYRSSDWAERAFCTKCGTGLFYRVIEADLYYMSLGLFDDQERWRMVSQIFTDEKPAYYDFANKTKMMTGAEVFAAVAGGEMPE